MNNWTGIAVVVIGYAIGLYFQNKRLDDFKEGLYRFLDVKFEAIAKEIADLHLELNRDFVKKQ